MTETTSIDFGRMESLTQAISAANQNIRSALTRLDDEALALRSAWSGDASDAYDKAHREWTATLAELNAVLAEITRTTADITQRHRAAEKKVQGNWG